MTNLWQALRSLLGNFPRRHPYAFGFTSVVLALTGLGVDKAFDFAQANKGSWLVLLIGVLAIWVLGLMAVVFCSVTHQALEAEEAKKANEEREARLAELAANQVSLAEMREKVQQGQDATIRALLRYLVNAVARGADPTGFRACIMLLNKDGTRRDVDARTAFNMDTAPDRNLSIENFAGASGVAVRNEKTVYADAKRTKIGAGKKKSGDREQGMTPTEKGKIPNSLKALLCGCLTDATGVFGTLNVDAHTEEAAAALNSVAAAELLAAVANAIALVRTSARVEGNQQSAVK